LLKLSSLSDDTYDKDKDWLWYVSSRAEHGPVLSPALN
jgi:hypothetical protein